MRYGIPLLGNRVAPRCTAAENLLLLTVVRDKVRSQRVITIHQQNWAGFVRHLVNAGADTLVCGGISRWVKDLVTSKQVEVLENVAGTAEEVTKAIQSGKLCPGFGFQEGGIDIDQGAVDLPETGGIDNTHQECDGVTLAERSLPAAYFDCLSCSDRICLRGETCDLAENTSKTRVDQQDRQILESAMDIACEKERTLCRLSELIYFCLDMKYQRLGVAFCIDLLEPADILVSVLRRFFDVYPVCCKIGGLQVGNPVMNIHPGVNDSEHENTICNPLAQARHLNLIGTDLNVLVGLCMGMDCLFAGASNAPVSTLFVKDRSLANNPIGALYSEYYLKEATRSSVGVR